MLNLHKHYHNFTSSHPSSSNANINVSTVHSDEADEALTTWELALQSGTLVAICLMSLLGNFIVAFTLFKREQLVSPSNRLVFNLTVSNFILTVLVLPFVVYSQLQRQWQFGIFWCNLSAFVTLLVGLASILTLAMIAVDRYYAIVKPMAYTLTITPTKSSAMLLWAWMQACICSLPPLFGWSRFEFQQLQSACIVVWDANLYYTAFVLSTCIGLPFTIMASCYYQIFQVARTKYRKVHVGTMSEASDVTVYGGSNLETIMKSTGGNVSASATVQHSRSVKPQRLSLSRKPSWMLLSYNSPVKGFWTICLVLGAFLMTWLPYALLAVMEMSCGETCLPSWYHVFALWMMYSSSVSYPLIYGLYNRSIRKEVRGCLCPPSSKAMQGLPRRNSRRFSFSGSLLDYSPFRIRGLSSRRLSSDMSRASVDLGSITDFMRVGLRKTSQDSGAVLTESDLETDTAFLSPSWPHRRVSAPSRLQHFCTKLTRSRETQETMLGDHHPLPILHPIAVPSSVKQAVLVAAKLQTESLDCGLQMHCIPTVPTEDAEKRNVCVIESSDNIGVGTFAFKNVWALNNPASFDEGIVNDCVVEDLD